jgi:acyl-coenzyme A synthetase/AMP-(fatty) acid ligase
VHWVDALPLTATGKLQRSALKDLHAQALERMPLAA